MQHWYAYHSVESMKRPYPSRAGAVYLTRTQSKLCFGDVIWIVEGDTNSPRQFSLVDCFKYEDTEYPPFPGEAEKFTARIKGASLLKHALPLRKEDEWFKQLHSKYITKQRFVRPLADEPMIVAGLLKESGLAF